MATAKFKKLPRRAQRAAFANMERGRARKKQSRSFKGISSLSKPGGRERIASLDRALQSGVKKKPKTKRQRSIAALDNYLRS